MFGYMGVGRGGVLGVLRSKPQINPIRYERKTSITVNWKTINEY